jgi:hypothetical protein
VPLEYHTQEKDQSPIMKTFNSATIKNNHQNLYFVTIVLIGKLLKIKDKEEVKEDNNKKAF